MKISFLISIFMSFQAFASGPLGVVKLVCTDDFNTKYLISYNSDSRIPKATIEVKTEHGDSNQKYTDASVVQSQAGDKITIIGTEKMKIIWDNEPSCVVPLLTIELVISKNQSTYRSYPIFKVNPKSACSVPRIKMPQPNPFHCEQN